MTLCLRSDDGAVVGQAHNKLKIRRVAQKPSMTGIEN